MKNSKIIPDGFDEAREQIHRQMLSAVSHDLKTPLATIIGSLEVYTRMGEKLSPEKKQMLIKSALQEAYRLDSFVTNILDMAKLENGLVRVKSDRCDLNALLQDCVTRAGPRIEKGKIVIDPKEGASVLHTDPMLLGRAVNIVLDNALKHAGKESKIRIEYGIEENAAWIRIDDNGPGIPAERMEDIFSKYTRLSRNDQQNAGTGLGLSICRQIMRLLSGSVNVKNLPEGGASFTLQIAAQ